ncbi:MAG: hypothetical protein M9942_02105 [Microthrixaceae bacterium]|nr:hypothetical protein [Microthrixaceae bacterium]
MSEAPDYLVEFTHEVAKLLEQAGAASFERDSVAELELVERAAGRLLRLFELAPEEVPTVTSVLGKLSPRVLGSELHAACSIAQDSLHSELGELSPLLEPRCLSWVNRVCEDRAAEHWPVLAGLAVRYSESGITRPGLPLGPITRDMASSARLPELEAMRDVAEMHTQELKARANRMTELLDLMGPRFTEERNTVRDAIEALSGPERVRAEELYATLPAIMCVGGGSE